MMHRAEELPHSLYKIGDAYFVRDGNHRVSVARQQGVEMIDAKVVELQEPRADRLGDHRPRPAAQAGATPGARRLPIDHVLPEIRLELSDVADYRRLATHIEAHGFRLSQLWKRYISPEETLQDWYEYHYAPIAEMVREERVLDAFPGRTELDLYLWIVNHRERLALEARDEGIRPKPPRTTS